MRSTTVFSMLLDLIFKVLKDTIPFNIVCGFSYTQMFGAIDYGLWQNHPKQYIFLVHKCSELWEVFLHCVYWKSSDDGASGCIGSLSERRPEAVWTQLVPLQGTAIRETGGASLKLGRGITLHSRVCMGGIVKNNPVNTKGKEEETGGGFPHTRASNFLQSIEQTTLKLLILQSMEDPTQKQLLRMPFLAT